MFSNLFFTIIHILDVTVSFSPPTVQVIVRMISNLMSAFYDLLKNRRVLFYIVSDTKERSIDIEFSKRIKDEFCGAGNRTIVKGQIELLTISWYSPRE